MCSPAPAAPPALGPPPPFRRFPTAPDPRRAPRPGQYPSALYVYNGAVATLSNVTFKSNLPTGQAIDCSDAQPTTPQHYLPDGYYASHVVDSGNC